MNIAKSDYRNITVSGKVAVGTSTLAISLQQTLGWKYVNTGQLQREWDRQHGRNENQVGALNRPDEWEKNMEQTAIDKLTKEKNLIYEAWLAGFVAKDIPDVLKVLLVCSDDGVRVDRVVNRDKISVEQARHFIKQREEENIAKWKKLYGDSDFWDPKYYNVVIDTYKSGPTETLSLVLTKLHTKK